MHVLVTADTVGGVWTYTRELVCGLIERGHRVTLVSFGKIPGTGQTSWMAGRNLSYHPTSFPLEWMQNVESGIAESAKFLEGLIATERPDLLHSSQFCYGSIACRIPKVVVAHSDVRSWWKAVREDLPWDNSWFSWYNDVVSAGLSSADVVVAPSRWMLDTIRENYGPSRARMQVIYNGRSPDLFQPAERKEKCVLAVGRIWDHAKQIRLLLDRKQSVPVRIAGKAEHPENAQGISLRSTPNVTFCGEQDEVGLRALYGQSSMYAATSRYEPFGLAPLEAALSRCALVANDIPTFRELWGEAAFYFRRNDAGSLADAIRLLSEDPRLRSEYGHRAYQRARQQFTPDRMISQYENLYNSFAARSTAA